MFEAMNRIRTLTDLRVRGDMPQRFLNCCARMGLELLDVRSRDSLCLELMVRSSDMKKLRRAALKSGCDVEVIRRGGAGRWLRAIRSRALPAVLACLLVALLFWSRFYVWEIKVSGCETVAAGRVLDALADCGVKCGAFWPAFSADNIRSRALCSLPELSWITVNMRGSLAEVIVVERREPPEMVFTGESADIVAERSGFVTQVRSFAGQSLVRPGTVVNKGDVLISGAVESSFSPPRFLRAWGSVTAEVDSSLTAVMPKNRLSRQYTGRTKRKFALIIGNHRINFYSDSSFSDMFCDKIISVWKAEADGLFSFPVSIERIEEKYYEPVSSPTDGHDAAVRLEEALRAEFLREEEKADVLGEKLGFAECGGLYTGSLRTRYRCEIGKSAPISEERRQQLLRNYIGKADE